MKKAARERLLGVLFNSMGIQFFIKEEDQRAVSATPRETKFIPASNTMTLFTQLPKN